MVKTHGSNSVLALNGQFVPYERREGEQPAGEVVSLSPSVASLVGATEVVRAPSADAV